MIAQELAGVMPEAVHGVGDVEFNNSLTVPNLLVVNERTLLYENILSLLSLFIFFIIIILLFHCL